MQHNVTSWPIAIALGLACSASAVGCGSRSRQFDRYIPEPHAARTALDRALAAWQNDQQPGQVTVGAGTVHTVDSQWQSGAKLESYEIIQQEPGEGARRFRVQLTLRNSNTPQEATYVIVGRDEVWVFRDSDYARISQ